MFSGLGNCNKQGPFWWYSPGKHTSVGLSHLKKEDWNTCINVRIIKLNESRAGLRGRRGKGLLEYLCQHAPVEDSALKQDVHDPKSHVW